MVYTTHSQARQNRYAALADQAKPMSDLNITPLIDVMLVLLVMMILTIPIATHQMEVPLPQGRENLPEQTDQFTLTLSRDGHAYWNDEAVTKTELGGKLEGLAAFKDPLLRFQSDPRTRYEDFAQHVKLVKDKGVSKIAFAGLSEPDEW